ncbi:hypothetical protein [Alkalinema pantanalense]|uniref:hypothetical protein n=1 Tax=Alkalinema pantanalense TaxID=1620705 RepID=UPI003D6E8152
MSITADLIINVSSMNSGCRSIVVAQPPRAGHVSSQGSLLWHDVRKTAVPPALYAPTPQ